MNIRGRRHGGVYAVLSARAARAFKPQSRTSWSTCRQDKSMSTNPLKRNSVFVGTFNRALMAVVTTVAVGVLFAPSAKADPAAAAPIQAFLDARYLPSDVKHSFHTAFGETIDCVDFFAQPGIKQLAAAGHPILQLPPPANQPTAPTSAQLPVDAFTGTPDDDGSSRACPASTVPMLRITATDIQTAGGLDSYLNSARKSANAAIPAMALPVDSSPQYAHVVTDYTGPVPITYAWANLGVFDPNVQADNCEGACQDDHSLSQTWLWGGYGQYLQSVEFGWNVDPG
jgi:hypothetical protein